MSTADKFCLRWDLRWDTFAKIKDYGKFFDCTIIGDDSEECTVDLRAHKVILSVFSEFFANILTKESICKNPNPLIYIRGISTRAIQNILYFIYNGEINLDHNEVDHFLEVAEILQIRGLMKGPIGTLVEHPEKARLNLDGTRRPMADEGSFKTRKDSPETFGIEDFEVKKDNGSIPNSGNIGEEKIRDPFILVEDVNAGLPRHGTNQSEKAKEFQEGLKADEAMEEKDIMELKDAQEAKSCADSVWSGEENEKPPFTYFRMISQALIPKKDSGMPLLDIYRFINQKYPYYKVENRNWQSAVRNQLSKNKGFEKVPNKSSCWRMKDDCNLEEPLKGVHSREKFYKHKLCPY